MAFAHAEAYLALCKHACEAFLDARHHDLKSASFAMFLRQQNDFSNTLQAALNVQTTRKYFRMQEDANLYAAQLNLCMARYVKCIIQKDRKFATHFSRGYHTAMMAGRPR